MKPLAGCLVVCLFASAAAWVGCRDDLDDLSQPLVGSGTDGGFGGDAYGGGTGTGSDGGVVVVVNDATGGSDGSGEGGVPDAGTGSGSDAGSGMGSDAGLGSGSDGGSGEGGIGDGGIATDDAGNPIVDGGGTGDALRAGELPSLDRTSFYACAGGPAPAGVELGLPIGLALVFAVRRRRRWCGSATRPARSAPPR